jgi:hypothetical protein
MTVDAGATRRGLGGRAANDPINAGNASGIENGGLSVSIRPSAV